MGKKEDALLYGTIIYLGLGIVFGIGLSVYVYSRTKDKSENGKYQKENAK